MKSNNKTRIIAILRILYDYTDEEHSLTIKEISQKLKEGYNIIAYRTTIQDDIESLCEAGIAIECIRSTQNRYSILDRIFDTAEIRVLIDAACSARFLCDRSSRRLIEKLSRLACKSSRKKLFGGFLDGGSPKTSNTRTIYIIDTIEEALLYERRISFSYSAFDDVLYSVVTNPGRLIWQRDLYYLICYNDAGFQTEVYRVDRIDSIPEILPEKVRRPRTDLNELQLNTQTLKMELAAEEEVCLVCSSAVLEAVTDLFEVRAVIKDDDNNTWRVKVYVVCSSSFFGYIFSFAGDVQIESPQRIRRKYMDMLKNAQKKCQK